MATTLDGRRVFIASPGGLEHERKAVRDAVAKFNRLSAIPSGVVFIDEGWEATPPGVGRGQSLINEVLDQCDYLIVLLADKWGRSPGGDQYTSGTEEEFMRSLANLADAGRHMRDIHVYFRSIPSDRLADPGPELSKVLEFKRKVQDSNQMLYGTFDSLPSLSAKIETSLSKWNVALEPKVPMVIDLGESPSAPQETSGDLVGAAIDAADAGRIVQAEILFARAVNTGDPHALFEAARFARRRGLLDDAIELNERVVAELSPSESRTTEESAYLVGALANIGVIHRKKGDLNRSVRSLEEAIEIARKAPQPLLEELTYSLDNLGHSLGQLGRHADAADAFREAASERQGLSEGTVPLPSRLNLGWACLRSGDNFGSLVHFEDALSDARGVGQLELANCLAGMGNALLEMGRAAEAIEHLKESQVINRSIGNSDGVGISSGLLARAYAAINDGSSADGAIQDILRESGASGNLVGVATGYWTRALVHVLRGDLVQADIDFEEALRLSRLSGNISLTSSIENSRSEGNQA